MLANADLTAYLKGVDPVIHEETWVRVQIEGVVWEESKAANVLKSGLLEADRVTVYVPLAQALPVKAGDVIVRGLVADEITSAFTITALKAKYPRSATVKSVDVMDRGSLAIRHQQIGAA